MNELEHPFYCLGCPALDTICPGVIAQVDRAVTNERVTPRKDGGPNKIIAIYSIVRRSMNPDAKIGKELRMATRPGFLETPGRAIRKIQNCRGRKLEGYAFFCPAVDLQPPTQKQR